MVAFFQKKLRESKPADRGKMKDQSEISSSLDILQQNLESTTQVAEWARLMGFKCPQKFARQFLRYFSIRPNTNPNQSHSLPR